MTPRQILNEALNSSQAEIWAWVLVLIGLGGAAMLLKRVTTLNMHTAKSDRDVHKVLKRNLKEPEYKVLGNLLLPDGKGGFTQVDHIILSQTGIFVVETKSWLGDVTGQRDDEQWGVSHSGGGRRRAMNPLLQNLRHVRVVADLLKIQPDACHNLVFVTAGANFKDGPVPGVLQGDLLSHIRSFKEHVVPQRTVRAWAKTLAESSLWDDQLACAAYKRHLRTRRKVRSMD